MHAHDHDHDIPENFSRAFAIGIGLNVLFVIIEAAAGFWTGSLMLLADAGHNLSDVLGLVLAWGGNYLATFQSSNRHTYGLRSTTILAALANGLLLLMAIGGIAWESIERFWAPETTAGPLIIATASVGIVINGITTMLFASGRHGDLNVRGAFLHMAADTLVSLGVVIAGLGIMWTGATWIDPTVSLLIAAIILWSTWDLLRRSFHLAILGVPDNIDIEKIRSYLESLPGVTSVHDLHIWAMSTTENALTVHLVRPDSTNDDDLLGQICTNLDRQFKIAHPTIQIERCHEAAACRLAQGDCVIIGKTGNAGCHNDHDHDHDHDHS
ncbi:cation diffusion facilitator family transporter [Lacunimicrobium album]